MQACSRSDSFHNNEFNIPITIQVPEGVFSPQAEDELASHLTDAIMSINGASDNPLARRHLIIPVSHMPADKLYAAGKPEPFVTWLSVYLLFR